MFAILSKYSQSLSSFDMNSVIPVVFGATLFLFSLVPVKGFAEIEGRGFLAEFRHLKNGVEKPGGTLEILGTMVRMQTGEGKKRKITLLRPDDGMAIELDEAKMKYNQLPYVPGSVWFSQFDAMRQMLQKGEQKSIAGQECDLYTAPMDIAQFCYSEKYNFPLSARVGGDLHEVTRLENTLVSENRFLPPPELVLGFSFPGLKTLTAEGVPKSEGSGNAISAEGEKDSPVFLPEQDEESLKMFAYPLRITTFPVQDGSTRSLDDPVVISFSQMVDSALFSFSVLPDSDKWHVSWSKNYRKATLSHSAPLLPETKYTVTLEVVGSPPQSMSFIAKERSPVQKLNHDLEKGNITLDQAAVFRMGQVLKPYLVPSPYRLKRMPPSGTPALRKVRKDFSKLSSATQDRLWPYFLSAQNPASYWYKILHDGQNSGSKGSPISIVSTAYAAEDDFVKVSHDTSSGFHIIIMGPRKYEEMVNLANRIIIEEDMFEEFHRLLGRTPPHPGDNELLIYIVASVSDISGDAEEPLGWCANLAHEKNDLSDVNGIPEIFISAAANFESDPVEQRRRLGSTLAHEMFHAFQDGFSWYYHNWSTEGTAVWAEDYINETWNTEQTWISEAFWKELHELKELKNGEFDYSMYLFPLFITRTRSEGSSFIRQLFEHIGTNPDPDADTKAAKAILGSQLKEIWKDYALALMDVIPESGKISDSMDPTGMWGDAPLQFEFEHDFEESELNEIGAGGFAVELDPLSASFQLVKNENQGLDAPAVQLDLSQFRQDEFVSVQAIIVYRDEHRVYEDWTDREKRVFCLSNPKENFKEIYIVVACSSDEEKDRLFTLNIYPDEDVDCLSGVATITLNRYGSRRWDIRKSYGRKRDSGSYTYSEKTSVRLLLEPWREDIPPQLQGMLEQMDSLYPEVEKHHIEAGKEVVKSAVRKPVTYDDPNTGLKVLKFRVTSLQVQTDSGKKNGASATIDQDSMGIRNHCRSRFSENTIQRGLDDSAEEWLKERWFKVELFVDPDSGEIIWVRLPSIGIEREIVSKSKSSCRKRYQNKRGDYYYKNESNDYHDNRENSVQLTHTSPAEERAGQPMDPVWWSEKRSRSSASGKGRIERPVDIQYDGPEQNGYINETNITEFKWRVKI